MDSAGAGLGGLLLEHAWAFRPANRKGQQTSALLNKPV